MNKNKKINLTLVNLWNFPAQSPHFGLLSLAAYINKKQNDVRVKIIEGENPLEDILAAKSDIIGFTSDTLMFDKTLECAMQVKKKVKTPLLIGGIHITASPESFNPVFEAGVIGEGEITLSELLEIYKKYNKFSQNKLKDIKGLVFQNQGKLVKTVKRDLIADIDELPFPARDLVPMKEYYLKDQENLFGVRRMATIMTSRGCPYHCVFCGSPVQWGKVRFHSAEYVVKEIKHLIDKYNIDGIMFWDDLFIAPEKRVERLTELIEAEGLNKKLTFFGYARANLINEKICTLLNRMNVKRLIFGLESGSEKILAYLKQNSVTVEDNKRAVMMCRKYHITSSSGYIVGTPGETLLDIKKTYELMKNYPLDNTHIYILTPYPGTKIWEYSKEHKLIDEAIEYGKLFVMTAPVGLRDFFRKDPPDILKDRIFLNEKYRHNKEYLRIIYEMEKLAFKQNTLFYIRTVLPDMYLMKRLVSARLRNVYKTFLSAL